MAWKTTGKCRSGEVEQGSFRSHHRIPLLRISERHRRWNDGLIPVNTGEITEKNTENKMSAFERRAAETGRTSGMYSGINADEITETKDAMNQRAFR